MLNHQKAQEMLTELVNDYIFSIKNLFNKGKFPEGCSPEEWIEDFIAFLDQEKFKTYKEPK